MRRLLPVNVLVSISVGIKLPLSGAPAVRSEEGTNDSLKQIRVFYPVASSVGLIDRCGFPWHSVLFQFN